MKVLIVSDIHGNSERFKKMYEFYQNEGIDKMIVLGDTFNGFLSLNSNAKEISDIMWKLIPNLVVIEGNCDSSYDKNLSPVGMVKTYTDLINEKVIFCHHGHKELISESYDIICSGHTHVARLYRNVNTIFLNPGSLSRPRDGSKGTFAVLSKKSITIFDIDYDIVDEMYF